MKTSDAFRRRAWGRAAAALAALCALAAAGCRSAPAAAAPPARLSSVADWKCDLDPLVRMVDLDVGESATVELSDGSRALVRLVGLNEVRDDVRDAVRRAEAAVEVDGIRATVVSATYHLPLTVGRVQIDCTITRGYLSNSRGNPWQLHKDARFRLWPAGSPWVRPGTLAYPVEQRWFATDTQFSNEPTFVDGPEEPQARTIYYHNGLDFGGSEGDVPVLAVADALVVQAGQRKLPDAEPSVRYDKVSILDRRGWTYSYLHLKSIAPGIDPGVVVHMGQRIGTLGKEGDSGGWSHLHMWLTDLQPNGRSGTDDMYAYAWQVYLAQRSPDVVAVARPHHLIWAGESARLDGSKSWSAHDAIVRYDWTFTDGSTARGPVVERTYLKPGEYNETLKVTDAEGRVAYDFAVVQVIGRDPVHVPPGLHAACWPTLGLAAGQVVNFKVRAFGTTHGEEVWDFGDGSPPSTTQSDGCVEALAPDGYARTVHRYDRPGDYVVTVRRSDEQGVEAVTHLWVRIGR
jgi:hypothetical protein